MITIETDVFAIHVVHIDAPGMNTCPPNDVQTIGPGIIAFEINIFTMKVYEIIALWTIHPFTLQVHPV